MQTKRNSVMPVQKMLCTAWTEKNFKDSLKEGAIKSSIKLENNRQVVFWSCDEKRENGTSGDYKNDRWET